jgi:hypothetical protein
MKNMREYVIGFAAGIALGASVPASAAMLLGRTGYLSGWTVTKDGDEVCYMPYVWTATKEIECD